MTKKVSGKGKSVKAAIFVGAVNVGVDVAKDHLDVHIHEPNKAFRVVNSDEGVGIMQRELSQYQVKQVVFESSGGYEYLMGKMLAKLDCASWCVEPQRIKAFIRSEGIKHKTDASDARLIAAFAAQKKRGYDKKPLTEIGSQLSSTTKRREELVMIIEAEKKRLQNPSRFDVINSIKRHIEYLEEEIKQLEKQGCTLVKSDPELREKDKLVRSIPGIGKVTSMVLLANVPELGTIGNKQTSALIGTAPFVQQSGTYEGRASINSGRGKPRRVLWMAALTASQHNEDIKLFAKRLSGGGKHFKVVNTAAMNKLIRTVNAVLKRGTPWQPGCPRANNALA